MRIVLGAALGAVLGLVFCVAGTTKARADAHALWRIVQDRCAVDEAQHRRPDPCAVYDAARGFAVLKDIRGREQYLLIPTARVAGIEDPSLLRPGAPDYFAEAWSEMALVEARLPHRVPPQDLSLAINSVYGRSQDQLHIHMECLSRDVRDALAADPGAITAGTWHSLPRRLHGHPYRAIRLPANSLGQVSPFQVLARSLHDPASEIGHHTLVLAAASSPGGGFILLDDRTSLFGLDRASGEELQDHACALAEVPPS